MTERTRLIFVCNPNNPTGTVVTADDLERFLRAVPSRVLVVIDEAYVHFDVDPASPSGIELFRRFPNVAVLHTFSKAYGLAGLRVGYAIAPAAVAAQLRKTALPFGVTALAQAAALSSLHAEAELQARVDLLVIERGRLAAALRELGIPALPSQANFLWLPLGGASGAFAGALEEQGISVRCFENEGVRITVGTPRENDAVIAAVRAVELPAV